MAPPRSDATLRTAVESMFRIRAVESPPDADGQRTIWHRGAKMAELVSRVDAEGLMLRQEFFLYDDVFKWERDGTLSTGGALQPAESAQEISAQSVAMDSGPDQRRPRIARAHKALSTYEGDDRYIGHLRSVILVAVGQFKKLDEGPVTRSHEVLKREESGAFQAKSVRARRVRRLRGIALVGGALIILVLAALAKILLAG